MVTPLSNVGWCRRCAANVTMPCRKCALRDNDEPTYTPIPLPAWAKDKRLIEKLNRPLTDTGLSVRLTNMLEKHHIFCVNDLLHQTRASLLKIPNLGHTNLRDIFNMLAGLGFTSNTNGQTNIARTSRSSRDVDC